MLSNTASDPETILAAVDRWAQDQAALAELSFDALSPAEALAIKDRLETVSRRQAAIDHRLTYQLTSQGSPSELGGRNWSDVLQQRLRISSTDARRRLDEAEDLGPRRAMTGEVLEPKLANVAKRQAAGEIGAEHVRIIRKFVAELPAAVDYETRGRCEETLATVAAEHTPAALRKAADRLAGYVNPDGEFSDVDRARRRFLTIGPQSSDGMSKITGLLDPEARATIDAVLAKLAAPGMCNPDDETPCVDGQPSEEALQHDARSPGQRNHDALKAAGRALLASGELGQLNGLPVSVIVSTTLQELQAGAGQAVTAGGTLLPMRDLIRMSSHAYHYLSVFDKHTNCALYLGRTRRSASPAQRIVLHAKDRGCSRPGCTVPGYWCEVHHAVDDWADGGETNIDELTLACGPDNRLVRAGGWTTRKRKDGRTEWIPPPHLDSGQARVNDFHHPENLLMPEEDEEEDRH